MGGDPFAPVLEAPRELADALTLPAASADEAAVVAALRGAVRRWASRHVDAARVDGDKDIPDDVLATAADMGLFGLTIPERWGGAGLSMTAASAILETLATVDRSVATTIGLHAGLGLRGLLRYGTDEQKDRWLPQAATGDRLTAFAATEAGAGSHIAAMGTTARAGEDGSLSLSGEKIFVTNGGLAGLYTVAARTPGLGGARRGTSILLVDREAPGVTVGREEDKLGIRGSSTTTVAFDEVALTPDRVIGEPGAGLDQLNGILAWGRTFMTSGCVGTARAAYERTLPQVTGRVQFGRPIGRFEQVREKVATMAATLYAMESVVRLTTLLSDLRGADIGWESSIAKVFASEGAWRVADDAVQLHGGSGYIEETGVARLLRDSRITRIFEGANEVLRAHIATAALGGAGEGRLGDALAPDLADEAARVDALADAVGETVARLRKRHGFRVVERQVALARLADALIGRWAAMATLLRADGEVRVGSDARRSEVLPVARHACRNLVRDARRALEDAEADTDLVHAITDGAYAPF
ncbi:MAG: acyl-CoA dehydrogenase family protein [Myxococcota bacterium]